MSESVGTGSELDPDQPTDTRIKALTRELIEASGHHGLRVEKLTNRAALLACLRSKNGPNASVCIGRCAAR